MFALVLVFALGEGVVMRSMLDEDEDEEITFFSFSTIKGAAFVCAWLAEVDLFFMLVQVSIKKEHIS